LCLLELGRNHGFAGGSNAGIEVALANGADYVWLLNNDTEPRPNALHEMVGVAEKDPEVGAVGSILLYSRNPSRVQGWGGGRVYFWLGICRHQRTPTSVSRVDYLTGASVLLRAAALRDVGLLDDGYFMYWEDVDLSIRLRERGWKIAVASTAHVLHKESASFGQARAYRERCYSASAVRFFKQHASVPIIPIVAGTLIRCGRHIVLGHWASAWAALCGAFQASARVLG